MSGVYKDRPEGGGRGGGVTLAGPRLGRNAGYFYLSKCTLRCSLFLTNKADNMLYDALFVLFYMKIRKGGVYSE